MSEIKKDVTDLAKVLKGKITIGDNGVATVKEGTYIELLPEGVTEDTVKALQAHNSTLVAAAALATGELGIDYMKKHKDVAAVELTIPTVGKDSLDITVKREKHGINPSNKEPIVSYGNVSAGFSIYSTRPRGELGKVKEHLAGLALKALG
jgi:hypothetical protein